MSSGEVKHSALGNRQSNTRRGKNAASPSARGERALKEILTKWYLRNELVGNGDD